MNWMEESARWYRDQSEQFRRDRGDLDYKCDCWVICTDECNERKQEWEQNKTSAD